MGSRSIPLSEVTVKDKFLNIKNVSRDNMLAAHRVAPPMMDIIPNNTGGGGDVKKARRELVRNKLVPLKKLFHVLNAWLDEYVIRFDGYTLN